MAHQRGLSTEEGYGHQLGVAGQRADGVHAAVDPAQSPSMGALHGRAIRQTGPVQLRGRDHAVLAVGHGRNRLVDGECGRNVSSQDTWRPHPLIVARPAVADLHATAPKPCQFSGRRPSVLSIANPR